MTVWIWGFIGGCILATAITVAACIVSGKISREEERKEGRNNK